MTDSYNTSGTATISPSNPKLMPADYSVQPMQEGKNVKGARSVMRRTRGIPANRVGKLPEGLYPRVSRKKLALALGLHISTVSGILMGKTKVKVGLAIRIAALVGVTVEKLSEDLERQGKAYWAARGRET